MQGRKAKPIAQKQREGNPGKRKLPAELELRGGEVVAGEFACPPGLPAEAKLLWDEFVPVLDQSGILNRVDRAALTALCVQWARAERARAVLESEGFFALGSTGQLVEHPAVAIERQAHQLFLRFAEHYGLTAAARARIAAFIMNANRPGSSELEDIVDAEPEPL